jgi:glycosyltransferase involved in cell wall biosynthesis
MLVAHPRADLYGSDRVLLESVAGMVSQGWRVVVTVPGPGPLLAELTARGAEVALCPAPVLRKSALRPREFLRFVREVVTSLWPCARLISRSRADGIYVNTITIPTWLVLGRLMGRSVTCHVHEAEGSASTLMRRLISLPLVFASRLIVNSEFSLEVLTEAVPLLRRRATVVYNGIPGPAEPTMARTQLNTPLTMLFIGRLSPRKGPHIAIAAVQELRSRGASVRLDLLGAVFPGYEWFEAKLKEQVNRLGLGDSVHFLGFQPDVWPHIEAADVVVVPSVVDEPFGNTAVEAILGARPLVVSSTSGLKEASAGYESVQAIAPDRSDLLATSAEHLVAHWGTFRKAAWEDSRLARDRHSVVRYQREIIRLLSD